MSYLGLWTETLCKFVNLNFHALNKKDCKDWPQVNWDLGSLGDHPYTIPQVPRGSERPNFMGPRRVDEKWLQRDLECHSAKNKVPNASSSLIYAFYKPQALALST
jgi:hypothetical protein